MQAKDFTITIRVDQTPDEVYKAINNVPSWWTGESGVEGSAATVGDEFTYRFKNIHYSKQRVTELIQGKKVVWLVTESNLSFISDRKEWNGTEIVFDISEEAGKTVVTFRHAGLVQDLECYNDCSNAWSFYISESLKTFLEKSKVPAV